MKYKIKSCIRAGQHPETIPISLKASAKIPKSPMLAFTLNFLLPGASLGYPGEWK
jgi:hypothetical protein